MPRPAQPGKRIKTELLRSAQITFNLRQWQLNAIRDAADAAGETVSEYLRRVAMHDCSARHRLAEQADVAA